MLAAQRPKAKMSHGHSSIVAFSRHTNSSHRVQWMLFPLSLEKRLKSYCRPLQTEKDLTGKKHSRWGRKRSKFEEDQIKIQLFSWNNHLTPPPSSPLIHGWRNPVNHQTIYFYSSSLPSSQVSGDYTERDEKQMREMRWIMILREEHRLLL